jgi:hypothetical protein
MGCFLGRHNWVRNGLIRHCERCGIYQRNTGSSWEPISPNLDFKELWDRRIPIDYSAQYRAQEEEEKRRSGKI